MPRLTDSEYIQLYEELTVLWRTEPSVFASISPREQWLVHAYFRPSESLTRHEPLTYRRVATYERPSLPAVASRSARKLLPISSARKTRRLGHAAGVSAPARNGRGVVRARALLHPAVDPDQLAKIVARIAWKRVLDKPEDDEAA